MVEPDDTRDGVFLILTNGNCEFLLQKRSRQKKLFPGLWTWTVTGHIKRGEHPTTAMKREMKEEMGWDERYIYPFSFGAFDRQDPVYRDPLNEDHWVHLFHARRNVDPSQLKFPQDEIEEFRWFSYLEVLNMPDKTPCINQVIAYMLRMDFWRLAK